VLAVWCGRVAVLGVVLIYFAHHPSYLIDTIVIGAIIAFMTIGAWRS